MSYRQSSILLFTEDWSVPKAGNADEQNEDAYRVERFPAANGGETLLIAVADGATEAVYSRLWARALVEAAGCDWPTLSDDELNARLRQIGESFSPISPDHQAPWFVRNKYLAQGSQATLLALAIKQEQGANALTLRAVAVGDCCLLLFKSNGRVESFPVRSSKDFGTNPVLSRSRFQDRLQFERWQTQIEPGDLLLACSDAVAKWLLECVESNQSSLIFDALRGLIAPQTPESEKPRAALNINNSSSEETPASMAVHNQSTEDTERWSFKQMIKRLWPWRDSTMAVGAGTRDDKQLTAPEPAQLPRLDFLQFVERHRSIESNPRMRNDDSTLIMCLAFENVEANERAEALKALLTLQSSGRQEGMELDAD